MKKTQLILIEWKDATIHGSGQYSRERALEEAGLTEGLSAGILVSEDKEQITIATDWFYEQDDFRCLSSYPKSGIMKITRRYIEPIGVSKKTKKKGGHDAL